MSRQLLLFDTDTPDGCGLRDPAFMANGQIPVHRWVPWIAGFSSQFVDDVFTKFLPANRPTRPVVLDPFAGVGTTLFEAALKGYDAVGFEINPYAALACRVKLAVNQIEEGAVSKIARDVEQLRTRGVANRARPDLKPAAFRSRIPFFSESVEADVLQLLNYIEGIEDPLLADLARLAFGAIMVSVSNYTYEPSLSTRLAAGKPLQEDADTHAAMAGKLLQMRDDIRWAKRRMQAKYRWQVHNTDFLTGCARLPAGSVRIAITSPPYLNNYHYVRNTRPQLFWLRLVTHPRDLKRMEETNFGKFWQTVRTRSPVEVAFKSAKVAEVVGAVRQQRRHAGPYGGPGWANYVACYFNDCYKFLKGLKRLLARRAVAVIVIGNSIIQGVAVETDLLLIDIAESLGLQVVDNVRLRNKRVGSSITNSSVRYNGQNGAKLYENAVILQKR